MGRFDDLIPDRGLQDLVDPIRPWSGSRDQVPAAGFQHEPVCQPGTSR
jgi:hypothetical protein